MMSVDPNSFPKNPLSLKHRKIERIKYCGLNHLLPLLLDTKALSMKQTTSFGVSSLQLKTQKIMSCNSKLSFSNNLPMKKLRVDS
jgi:hypothetical protein